MAGISYTHSIGHTAGISCTHRIVHMAEIWYTHSISHTAGISCTHSKDHRAHIWYTHSISHNAGISYTHSIGHTAGISYAHWIGPTAGISYTHRIGHTADKSCTHSIGHTAGISCTHSKGQMADIWYTQSIGHTAGIYTQGICHTADISHSHRIGHTVDKVHKVLHSFSKIRNKCCPTTSTFRCVRLPFNVTILWCFIVRYVGHIKIKSLYHIAIHYWVLTNVWSAKHMNIPPNRFPTATFYVYGQWLLIFYPLRFDSGSHIYHQPLLKSGLTWCLSDKEAYMAIWFVFHKYE